MARNFVTQGTCVVCNAKNLEVMPVTTKGIKGTRKMCHACIRHNNRYNNYGITLEQFNFMRRNQNYCCALCKIPETKCKRPGPGGHFGLVVDHCHATNQVRSLLCHKCNTIVGYCDENPEILSEIARYIKFHRGVKQCQETL